MPLRRAGVHPFFSDTLARSDVLERLLLELLQVLLALADGLGVALKQARDVLQTAVVQAFGLNGSVAATVILAQGAVKDLHGLLDIGRIRERDRHGFNLRV
jgi:hypothetical protein